MAGSSSAEPRTHRIEARIAPKALVLTKRAAEAEGSSVSDFVVAAARDAAVRELEEQNIIGCLLTSSASSSPCCLILPSRTRH